MTAVRAVVGAGDDPFRSSVLVREEHGRVLEEATARSLVGGRRVVRVLDATDRLRHNGQAGRDHRAEPARRGRPWPDRPFKLRLLAEKASALGVDRLLSSSGRRADRGHQAGDRSCRLQRDARRFAIPDGRTQQDLATRQAELEKLLIFAAGSDEIDREMASRCCATSAEPSFGVLFGAVMRGDLAAVELQLEQVVADGATGPGLIAAFNGHAQRVLKVRLAVESGQSAEDACKTLYPPVFFNQTAGFLREVKALPASDLMALLSDVRGADLACKRGGSRDAAIAGQFLVVAARRALRRARSSRTALAGRSRGRVDQASDSGGGPARRFR